MFDWQDFETVFRSKLDYTPDQKQIETTLRHRKEFQGSLFFDRIWNNIGLKQRKCTEMKWRRHESHS